MDAKRYVLSFPVNVAVLLHNSPLRYFRNGVTRRISLYRAAQAPLRTIESLSKVSGSAVRRIHPSSPTGYIILRINSLVKRFVVGGYGWTGKTVL